MMETEVCSLEYLKELSRLHDGWEEDAACVCCDWAVKEIKRLQQQLTLTTICLQKAIGFAQDGRVPWQSHIDTWRTVVGWPTKENPIVVIRE